MTCSIAETRASGSAPVGPLTTSTSSSSQNCMPTSSRCRGRGAARRETNKWRPRCSRSMGKREGETQRVSSSRGVATIVYKLRALLAARVKTSSPDKIACAPSSPAPRQCTPPRLAHSLRRTRLRPHSATRILTQHVSCELLAATHTHNTLHCTYTFLLSALNKRVMIFLDIASTTHAPRASSRFSYTLRASPALFCTRILNREHEWQHLCSLLR